MQAARLALLLPVLLAAEPSGRDAPRDCRHAPVRGEGARCKEYLPALPEERADRVQVDECLCSLVLADGKPARLRSAVGRGYWQSLGHADNTSAWRTWRIRRIAELEARVRDLERKNIAQAAELDVLRVRDAACRAKHRP